MLQRSEGVDFTGLVEPGDAAALAAVNGDSYAAAVLGPFAKLWGTDVASLSLAAGAEVAAGTEVGAAGAGAAAAAGADGSAGAAGAGGP